MERAQAENVLSKLDGQKIASAGGDELARAGRELDAPNWLLDWYREYGLSGACLSLQPSFDRSGQGVEAQLLTPEQLMDEASNCWPGTHFSRIGYLPFASCLEGSGDYYYLRISAAPETTAVVRIRHDLPVSEAVEIVNENVLDFLSSAQ